MRSQLAISFGQYSGAGAKEANQDFHGLLVPEGGELVSKGIAVALADGISTSTMGAAAAETAVKSFLSDYYATSDAWSVQTCAERVIAATNSWMHAHNQRTHGRTLTDESRERGMVCTFTGMVFKSRLAHLFHIGDARVARLSGLSLEPLTDAYRVYLGGGESYLGRAMGTDRHVEIDYRQVPLQAGDVFVLTTDGVHEYLSDTAIAGIVCGASDLDDAAQAIAAAALANDSPDNLTVQILRIESMPDGSLDDLVGAEATLPPAPQLVPGQDFEGYAIEREIHSGSRSHVYLARDKASGARVAIKVPATDHAHDEAQMQALLLEEWVARRVSNPHLLQAAPVRDRRAYAYCVTEYVEGQTLDVWMNDHRQPDLALVRSILGQIARGLQALHRREMIHRDLRPRNIVINGEATAKIIDFGSVQVAGLEEVAPGADNSMFAGTMQFSAPELYLVQPASPVSDIYSLGVIAYRMLTGDLPYGPRLANATTRAAQRKLRYTPVIERNPSVPDWMDAAIAKACAIDPGSRYGELSEFVYDLSYPNPALSGPDALPLLARNPVLVWQAISAILGVMVAILLASRGH